MNRHHLTILAVILGLGALLRARDLGSKSLWFNEADSVCFLDLPAAEIVRRSTEAYAVHPPLYFLALKGWAAAWGDSDIALRSLAVVCGLAVIPGADALVRALSRFPRADRPAWSDGAALLAAALVALSPLQIHFSRQVRGYSMGAMFLVWGGWALVRALEGGAGCGRFWAAAVALDLAACYTHHVAALVVGAQGLFALSFLAARRRQPGTPLRAAALAAAVFAAGYVAPELPRLLPQDRTVRHGGIHDPITWHDASEQVFFALAATSHTPGLSGPEAASAVWPAVALVAAVLAALGWRGGWRGRFLAVVGSVPPLAMAALSLDSNRSLLKARYLVFTQTFWLAAAAALLAGGLGRRGERAVLSAWILGLSCWACWESWPVIGPAAEPGLRAAVAFALDRRRPGELVVARTSDAACGLRRYTRGRARPLFLVAEPVRERQRGAEHLKDEHLITPEALVAARPTGVWFFTGRSYVPEDGVPFEPPEGWELVETASFGRDYFVEGPVTVRHYRTPAAP